MVIKEFLLEVLTDLDLGETLSGLITNVIIIVLWIIMGAIIIVLFKKLSYRVLKIDQKSARTLTIGRLINSIFRYFVWFIVFISILAEMEIDITPFIASAGVIGLAIGFGAQEIVKDFISGFFIIFEGLFDVGDVVEIDGFKGNVSSLGLRTTTIVNWKGEVKSVNNGDVRSMINYSKNDSIAIVEFGVAYETNFDKLQDVMNDYVNKSFEKYDDIIEVPKFLGVNGLGDSSVDMIMIAKTKNGEHFQIQRKLRLDLIKLFEENDINIPYPHLVLKND